MKYIYKKNAITCISSIVVLLIVVALMVIDTNNKKMALYTFEGIIIGTFLFSAATCLISIILFFLKEQVFNAWWKFAKWYLFGAAVLIAISPVSPSGDIVSVDAELIAWFLAIVFFIVSLVIIIHAHLRNRDER